MAKNNNIEDTLNSLDGLEKAKANPFLFTRITARMANSGEAPVKWGLVLRYAFLIMALVAINAIILVKYNRTSVKNNSEQQLSEYIASEYTTDSYDNVYSN